MSTDTGTKFNLLKVTWRLLRLLAMAATGYGATLLVPEDAEGLKSPEAIFTLVISALALLREVVKHWGKLKNGVTVVGGSVNGKAVLVLVMTSFLALSAAYPSAGCNTWPTKENVEALVPLFEAAVTVAKDAYEIYAANEALRAQLGEAEWQRGLQERELQWQKAMEALDRILDRLPEKTKAEVLKFKAGATLPLVLGASGIVRGPTSAEGSK
jgi:hypothetical protein